MDVSQFDPALFLEATTTEAATRRPPLPIENPGSPDGLYTGILGEPKVRVWTSKSDSSKSGIALDIPITLEVPQQLQDSRKLQPQVVLTGGGFVDLTEAGTIDWSPGKNRALRLYREATNLNVAGQPFAFKMFAGKVVKVRVENEAYTPKGATNSEIVDKIGAVLKA